MARSPKPLTQTLTSYPDAPVVRHSRAPEMNESQWTSLAVDLWNIVTASYSARANMEANLKEWMRLYELDVNDKDWPFVKASNVPIPIVPAKLDTLLSQLVSKTLVPEFILVQGNTQEAQYNAYEVQRYLNNELRRQRGTTATSWLREMVRWIHFGLRDGTGIIEALWRKDVREEEYSADEPVQDEKGIPQFDENGELLTKKTTVRRKVVRYDDVELLPVQLRDFMFIPDEAFNVEQAAGVMRAIWPYESDLWAMTEEGLLSPHWVKLALEYVPIGEDDTAADRQGAYDKNAGGQISVGQGQGAVVSEFFRNRGPIKVWRIHTRQFDMDGDGIPEENVFWFHEISNYLLGWKPAQEICPQRPFFLFSPMPRPDRPYGYSVPERLAPLYAEICTIHNQRNDEITMRLSPPLLINQNEDIADKNMEWGPGKSWTVSDVNTAAKPLVLQDIPIASWQEEAQLNSYAEQLIGISAPATGGMNAGRRTAKEIEISTASGGSRADLMAMEFRLAARALMDYIVKLKVQYMSDKQPQNQQGVSRQVLALDFSVDVAGTSDPIDAQSHLNETLAMYQLFSQDRDVQQDAVKRYELKKMVLQAFRLRNVEAILGTEQESLQRKQQEEQQAQQQMQMQQQLAQAKVLEETQQKAPSPPQRAQHAQAQQQDASQQNADRMLQAVQGGDQQGGDQQGGQDAGQQPPQ